MHDIRVEELLVDGEAQTLASPQRSASPGRPTQPIVILPGPQRLDLRYACLYFSAPERATFMYRLAGLDSDWVEAGSDRVAPYTHVPSGTYRFDVTVQTGNGVWTQPPASVDLVVLPHFWQTWWFRFFIWASAVALVAVFAALEIRRRHRLRVRALENQRAIDNERSRIAQDMHDELGSRLTKASMVSEALRRAAAEAPALQPRFVVLRDTLDKMTVTMDELVWAVNPQHDTLDGLASYVIRFTQEFLADTSIDCVLNVPTDFPAISLSSHARHNLFLAFEEACKRRLKSAAGGARKVRHLPAQRKRFWSGWVKPSMGVAAR